MTLTTAVHGQLLLLESDLAAVPTYGLGVYAIHSHHRDYRDIAVEKLGGSERLDVPDQHIAEWVGDINPMPGCYHGLVLHFERGDLTYLISALRGGVTIIIERVLNAPKARCFVVPPSRIMAGACVDVAMALHRVVEVSEPTAQELPEPVLRIAEALGVDPNQFAGFFVAGFRPEGDE